MRHLKTHSKKFIEQKNYFGIRIYSSDVQKEIPASNNVTPMYPLEAYPLWLIVSDASYLACIREI